MSEKLRRLKEQRSAEFDKADKMRKDFDGKEMDAEQSRNFNDCVEKCHQLDAQIAAEERYLALQSKIANEGKKDVDLRSDVERHREAFRQHLCDPSGLTPEQRALLRDPEKRAAITGQASTNLIPSSMANLIEVALGGKSALLNEVDVLYTQTGGDLTLPTFNSTSAKASIVAEYGQSSRDNFPVGGVTLKSYTYRTPIIPISYELLQDSAFNIEGYISNALADSVAAALNDHFTNGTGNTQPSGILKDAVSVEGSAAEAISFDDVLDLMAGVNSSYDANAKFMLNRKTLIALMKIKDSNKNYIWQPANAAAPATIFGKSYIINDDMPDIASGQSPIIYGDLKKYKARIVKNFTYLRLNEMLAEWLSVGLMGFARADGALVDAGTHPVAKLTLA